TKASQGRRENGVKGAEIRSRRTNILVNQTGKAITTHDQSARRPRPRIRRYRLWRTEPQPSMWTMPIVVVPKGRNGRGTTDASAFLKTLDLHSGNTSVQSPSINAQTPAKSAKYTNQKATQTGTNNIKDKSAKPPLPVQIRAAPPIFLRNLSAG